MSSSAKNHLLHPSFGNSIVYCRLPCWASTVTDDVSVLWLCCWAAIRYPLQKIGVIDHVSNYQIQLALFEKKRALHRNQRCQIRPKSQIPNWKATTETSSHPSLSLEKTAVPKSISSCKRLCFLMKKKHAKNRWLSKQWLPTWQLRLLR